MRDATRDRETGTRHEHNGFSLVELMVVLFIMALLAAVVAYNVIPVGDKAKVVAARADIATLDQSLEMYRLDLGAYPSQAEGLAALRKAPAGLANAQDYRSGGYIKDLPDDPWGHPYQYRTPGDEGRAYEVYSLGADGQPGGSGLDADITAKKD